MRTTRPSTDGVAKLSSQSQSPPFLWYSFGGAERRRFKGPARRRFGVRNRHRESTLLPSHLSFSPDVIDCARPDPRSPAVNHTTRASPSRFAPASSTLCLCSAIGSPLADVLSAEARDLDRLLLRAQATPRHHQTEKRNTPPIEHVALQEVREWSVRRELRQHNRRPLAHQRCQLLLLTLGDHQHSLLSTHCRGRTGAPPCRGKVDRPARNVSPRTESTASASTRGGPASPLTSATSTPPSDYIKASRTGRHGVTTTAAVHHAAQELHLSLYGRPRPEDAGSRRRGRAETAIVAAAGSNPPPWPSKHSATPSSETVLLGSSLAGCAASLHRSAGASLVDGGSADEHVGSDARSGSTRAQAFAAPLRDTGEGCSVDGDDAGLPRPIRP